MEQWLQPSSKSVRKMKSKEANYDPNIHRLPWYGGLLLIALVAFCGTGSYLSFFYLPPALTEADLKQHPFAFNGARAWDSLTRLDALGPKATGSRANEEQAVQVLEHEFTLINASRHPAQEVLYEKQIVSGQYGINFFGSPMTSVYRRVQNLIVKLTGVEDQHALMLNCHFDSVASSPGASDDCGSCAVMLEILRVLSRAPERNRHPIVFLFNGAEETPLQASHGFITEHRWARKVRAFLNLESAGSGGKELLFQSGPQHPWLIEAYSRAVRHPFGQAIGEEIFQSGLIPSDTDFRIFRDFGHIPGLDFAHIFNGYRYHTRFDSVQYLSPAVLQRTGDNILSLVRLLANGDQLARSTEKSEGSMVFFDFLGLLFISYSAIEGTVLNIAVSISGILVGFWSVLSIVGWRHWLSMVMEILHGFVATLVGAGAAIGINLVTAFALDYTAVDRSMSWYSSCWLVIGLYCVPSMMLLLVVHREFHRLFSKTKTVLSLTLTVQARITGVSLFWSLITIGATAFGLRSAYVIAILLTLALSCTVLITALKLQSFPSGYWLIIYLIVHSVALLWTTQFYHIFTNIFIPITGRSGANDNPDFIIGTVAAACTIFSTSFLIPLVNLLRKPYRTISTLLALFTIALTLATVSPLGFPYTAPGPSDAPKVQRILVQHTVRQFFPPNDTQTVRSSDAGYLFRLWDRHNERTVRGVLEAHDGKAFLTHALNPSDCKSEVFCGLPCSAVRFTSLWSPQQNRPHTPEMVQLSLNGWETVRRTATSSRIKLTFNLNGSFQSSLLVRPKRNVTLIDWNLTADVPAQLATGGHKAYFILITHGLAGDPVTLTLELEADRNPESVEPFVDISVTSNFWEYQQHFTDEFRRFVGSFPSWAHVVPSVTVVNVYSF
ncbi:endoplasmic reticulum metallopeptidase 1-like [Anopheles moucheti]|uniref:endoplasmic reticulum metallopeptidase 1-like n=1 Tax=Anopheles moucheti TaxID=186751 RepID=UPI0022F05DBD|nr:endoplasmic reticulum metallopeptidase 1-like [Anopheles moucheti]